MQKEADVAGEQDAGKRGREDEDGSEPKRIRSGEMSAYLKKLLEEELKIIPFATVRCFAYTHVMQILALLILCVIPFSKVVSVYILS